MRYGFELYRLKGAKVVCVNKYYQITELQTILSEEQLVEVSKSSFGHFMKLPNFKLQNHFIHILLVRQLEQPNSDKI